MRSIYRITKSSLWLVAILPLLFFSDVLYGAMQLYGLHVSISPGIVLRGFLLAVSMYMILIRIRFVEHQLLVWIILLIISSLPGLLIGALEGQDLSFEITVYAKVLYMPLIAGLLSILINRYSIESDKIIRFIEYTAYILGIILLTSQIMGLEKKTYGDYAFGSKGIFHAQNDLTLAFGLGLLASTYRLVVAHFSWFRLILLILSIYACLQIGTRASLAVVIISGISVIIYLFWGSIPNAIRNRKSRSRNWVISLSIVIATILMATYFLSKQLEFDYQRKKFETITQGEFPRMTLADAGFHHLEERFLVYDLLGEGVDTFQRGVAQHFNNPSANFDRRVVEVDWMDLFGYYGIVFVFILHSFVIFIFLGALFRFVVYHNSTYGLIAIASLVYLGHSIVAGHALTTPIPGTVIAAYFSIFFSSGKNLYYASKIIQ